MPKVPDCAAQIDAVMKQMANTQHRKHRPHWWMRLMMKKGRS